MQVRFIHGLSALPEAVLFAFSLRKTEPLLQHLSDFSLDANLFAAYNREVIPRCCAAGSARGLGPRGRVFESRHLDQKAEAAFAASAFIFGAE